MQPEPTAAELAVQAPSKTQRTGVKPHRWTARELWRLLDKGFFNGKRIELIEGVIFAMASQKNFHALSIKLTEDALEAAFGPNFWVRVQASLDLTPYSVVDPDLAVILGSPRTHANPANPTTALLIVEVSDTTLAHDRRIKGSLYAKVGIADYWIVNLKKRVLEVRRRPIADAKARYGFSYGQRVILASGDAVQPLAAPHVQIAVADMLP